MESSVHNRPATMEAARNLDRLKELCCFEWEEGAFVLNDKEFYYPNL